MGKKIIGVLLIGLALASVHLAKTQQPKVYRIGVVTAGGAWYEVIDGLRVGLKQLGLVEGKQFTLAIRDTKGDTKAAEEAAKNLEQDKANLIYTTQTSVTLATSGRRQTSLSSSVPGPTRLTSGLWRASQNRAEDSQASSTGTPMSLRSVWRY
jgi:ABC-type uncharacterized transport system substrate-binding protein